MNLRPHDLEEAAPLARAVTSGAEWSRARWLITRGRDSLARARLCEGHLDAVTILAEAGLVPHASASYGIWASRGPSALHLTGTSDKARLSGHQHFCSGADLVDRALVYVYDLECLVEVDLREDRASLKFDDGAWQTSALAQTHTWSVTFEDSPVTRVVGDPGWYFERDGFCRGALRPAACWLGGALSLLDVAEAQAGDTSHRRTHLGAMRALAWTMDAALRRACEESEHSVHGAFPRALAARHCVERGCAEILDRLGRGWGPRPLAFDREVAERVGALQVYIRQCHAERDLEELGRASTDGWAPEVFAPPGARKDPR